MDPGIESISLNLGEEVNLNLGGAEPIKLDGPVPGIELLANSSKMSTKPETFDNIDELERSLDDLANTSQPVTFEPEKTQTWDGYSKYENIPSVDAEQQNKEDVLHEKFKYVRMLEDLEKKGVSLSKKYDMESSLLEMKGEYETIIREKEKSNSIKFQGKMLMAFVTGVEFMNNKFDPFDIKMDGWGEQINENLSEYDEIFSELHEKYKSKGKMAPEIKLMFQLAGSAIMIHMTNAMFKSSMPGMDDIMRQNPDLMQNFTRAAVDQMSKKNEGFGNFMSMAMPETRPDLNFAQNEDPQERSYRAEMKGPNDISDILSGLKTNVGNDKDIEELSVSSEKQPKSRRKRRSDKNTISLNL